MDVSIILFVFKEKAFFSFFLSESVCVPYVVIECETWSHYLMLISASVSGLFNFCVLSQ